MSESDYQTSSRDGRGKSEFLKKISAGKTLCSEVNKASSNAKFLHMRRHHAFLAQLSSAQQSMLVENGRAQKEMRRQLDVYKKRKRNIFRDRVLAQQDDNEEEGDPDPSNRQSHPLSTAESSRGGLGRRRSSSSYSVNLAPPGGSLSASSGGTGMFPAILRVPMVASDDDNIHSAIQRQLLQHMRRQESLHSQILRSRVHDFCSDISARHSFYVTVPPASSSSKRIVPQSRQHHCQPSARGSRQTLLGLSRLTPGQASFRKKCSLR